MRLKPWSICVKVNLMTRREFAALPLAAAQAGEAFESAFSPREGRWNVAWPGVLAQHDLVYQSPPEDPMLGLPIGNGDIGALLWTTERELIVAINKNDIWDDAEPGPFRNWGSQEEGHRTSLRHAARLVIDFGCPVFDLLYQKEFEGRLELATATATIQARTPFATSAVSAFLSAPHKVLVVRCEPGGAEPMPWQVRLERWGSRTFAHWYSQVNRDASIGLEGTAASVERRRIVIRQKLRTMEFAVVAEIVSDVAATEPVRLHSRAGGSSLPAGTGATIFITAVTSEEAADPAAEAHRILDAAVASGMPRIRAAHEEAWKRFWTRSLIDLPEKYLENIWHLTLYFANSASRGKYPPHFCNGLWGWNRDFVPWNYYFHWNMQDYVWPLHAANHADLAAPYYRYRGDQLKHSIEYTKGKLKKPGAFYSDVADRHGYNDRGEDGNRTPGSQIALDFWRHYAFTGDEKFLREAAWPVIREVTRYMVSNLEAANDGFYHTRASRAYEGSPPFDDVITELAMLRALFPVAIKAGKMLGHEPSELERWREMIGKLAPFHLAPLEEFEFERRGGELVHKAGLAPGVKLASARVFAVGRSKQGDWVRNRFAGRPDKSYYGIPDPELAPVFPAGVIGLKDKGSELFNAAVTQVRLHPATAPAADSAKPGTMAGSGDLCMGWCPYPIALARLGLADELADELVNSVSTWQYYPQGFGHYGPFNVFTPDVEQRWRLNAQVRDSSSTTKPPATFPFPTWPFRHFDNEAMPIVSAAINEMLLQSYDGVIRVCPAVPAKWDVRFTLAAQGGFLISAERAAGAVRWVAVESRAGGMCRIERPWSGEGLVCLDVGGARMRLDGDGPIVEFPTEAGSRYLLLRNEADLGRWRTIGLRPERRMAPRKLKRAILGREKLY